MSASTVTKNEPSAMRRKMLIGLGAFLAGAGAVGIWRLLSNPSKDRSLFLFKRRSHRAGLPPKDSIFYPRDSEVRSKLAGRPDRT